MAKTGPIMVKYHFLTPGGRNMQYRKKSNEIKKIHHILQGHLKLQDRSTTDLLNSAEFGCSEENESCSGGYPEFNYIAGENVCACMCHVLTLVGRRPIKPPQRG